MGIIAALLASFLATDEKKHKEKDFFEEWMEECDECGEYFEDCECKDCGDEDCENW